MIGFYKEKGSPSTLFESYKFTISNKGLTLTDLNGKEKEINSKSLEIQVQDLLHEFESINDEIKPLPEECFVTMRLVYDSSTPEGTVI